MLNFRYQDTGADRMQGTRRDKEYIASMDRHRVADFRQGVITNAALKFFFCNRAIEPVDQFGAFLTIHHIPHFGFAVFAFVL